MKILVIPNSFKGTLDSKQAALAIIGGLKKISPKIKTEFSPISDGGDGFIETIRDLKKGKIIRAEVKGPLGRKVKAEYFMEADKTAFIEMAQASGIKHIKSSSFNCMKADTFGTGSLIKDAAARGAKKIVVGLGGSASNDGGAGCAAGFGFQLLDKNGKTIPRGAEGLFSLKKIIPKKFSFKMTALADVENLLCGKTGSARIFGPQKGASPEQVLQLEKALTYYSKIIKKLLKKDIKKVKGGAAAGGLGAGLFAFFNAEIKDGSRFIMSLSKVEKKIADCDIIITGEGKFDAQSVNGKAFREISKKAREYRKPIMVICGKSEISDKRILKRNNIVKIIELTKLYPLENLFKNPAEWLKKAVYSEFRPPTNTARRAVLVIFFMNT